MQERTLRRFLKCRCKENGTFHMLFNNLISLHGKTLQLLQSPVKCSFELTELSSLGQIRTKFNYSISIHPIIMKGGACCFLEPQQSIAAFMARSESGNRIQVLLYGIAPRPSKMLRLTASQQPPHIIRLFHTIRYVLLFVKILLHKYSCSSCLEHFKA